ncbi:hypothetical protein NQZ68_011136 [Dissostichus eleginoides]|nr:hypothetical protein NQZ68_011136 [Dissostichus eleginoides]
MSPITSLKEKVTLHESPRWIKGFGAQTVSVCPPLSSPPLAEVINISLTSNSKFRLIDEEEEEEEGRREEGGREDEAKPSKHSCQAGGSAEKKQPGVRAEGSGEDERRHRGEGSFQIRQTSSSDSPPPTRAERDGDGDGDGDGEMEGAHRGGEARGWRDVQCPTRQKLVYSEEEKEEEEEEEEKEEEEEDEAGPRDPCVCVSAGERMEVMGYFYT